MDIFERQRIIKKIENDKEDTKIKVVNNTNDEVLEIIIQDYWKKIYPLITHYYYYIDTELLKEIKELMDIGYDFVTLDTNIVENENVKAQERCKEKVNKETGNKYYEEAQTPYLSFTKKKNCEKKGLHFIYLHFFAIFTTFKNFNDNYNTIDIWERFSKFFDCIDKDKIIVDHIQKADFNMTEEARFDVKANSKHIFDKARNNNCKENLCFLDSETNKGKKAQYIDRSKNIRISTNEKGEYNINIFLDTPIKINSYNKEIETKAICIVNENILQRNGNTEEEIKNNIKTEAKNIRNIINSMDMFVDKNANINNEGLLKYIEGKHIYFIEHHKEKNANYNGFIAEQIPLDKQKEKQIIIDIEIKEIKKVRKI